PDVEATIEDGAYLLDRMQLEGAEKIVDVGHGWRSLLERHVREQLEHLRRRRRLQDGPRSEVLRLRIRGLPDARRGAFEIVLGVTELDVGANEQPISASIAERHSNAARVDHARAADHAIELHVRVAADNE